MDRNLIKPPTYPGDPVPDPPKAPTNKSTETYPASNETRLVGVGEAADQKHKELTRKKHDNDEIIKFKLV